MQESFYREGSFEDVHSFCALHDPVFCAGAQKPKEIYKDIFSGYMKGRGLNVDCVIIGLLRNRI